MAMAPSRPRGFSRHVGGRGTFGVSTHPRLGFDYGAPHLSNPRLVRLLLRGPGSPPSSSDPRKRHAVLPRLLGRRGGVGCFSVAWGMALQPRKVCCDLPCLCACLAPDIHVDSVRVSFLVSDELNTVVATNYRPATCDSTGRSGTPSVSARLSLTIFHSSA